MNGNIFISDRCQILPNITFIYSYLCYVLNIKSKWYVDIFFYICLAVETKKLYH